MVYVAYAQCAHLAGSRLPGTHKGRTVGHGRAVHACAVSSLVVAESSSVYA